MTRIERRSKTWRASARAGGLLIAMTFGLLAAHQPPVYGLSAYRQQRLAFSGPELAEEMHHYDPNVLHIRFGAQADAGDEHAFLPPDDAFRPAPEDLFTPARFPARKATGLEPPASDPNEIAAAPQSSHVPEPGTFGLLGLGLGLAALTRRARQKPRRQESRTTNSHSVS